MKSVYFHLLVALAIFAGCSESSDESLVVVDEISEGTSSSIRLSSSPVSSSTPVSSSVTSSSSATDSISSSKTSSCSSDVSSSSKQEPASSSSSEPSPEDLSSSVKNSSSSSKPYYAKVDIDSVFRHIEATDSRPRRFRMLYPVEDEKLDTGFFNVSDCEFSLDGMFKCAQRGCVAYVGGTYASGSTDKLLLIDVNLGDSALTSFIPYADFPAFNENRARNFLSTFRKESCTTLYHYEGNYQLEAEGLPEGIILYADDIIPDFAGWDKEEYSLIVKADKLDSIEDLAFRINDNSLRLKPEDGIYNERDYIFQAFYQKDSCQFSASLNDYGCGILSHTFYKQPTAGYCHGWELPDLAKYYSYRLLNISNTYPRGPFEWTLKYKDQYGRGGSVKIKSEFK